MSSSGTPAPRPGAQNLVLASVSAATLAALPSMLLGGLALLVRDELKFGAFELGAAIAVFFAVSAVVSVPAGFLSERIGPRRTLLGGAAITTFALIGAGALSDSWATFIPWMAIGGAGNTLTQVSTNHLIARRVPAHRQGLAYGVKQSAIPLAGILAGLALPILGLSVGWRATYGLAALGFIPVVLLLRQLPRPVRQPQRTPRSGDAPIPALALLSIGAGLATAAGSALTAFTVAAAVSAGFEASVAGLLLAAGSLAGVSARVGGGWIADRMGHGSLLLAGGLVGAGVFGYLGLAFDGPAVTTVFATLVAFAGGWGYPGLVLLAVARTNPRSPATAMGVIRLGPSVGAIIGPLAFGAVVDGPGYSVAWLMAAAAALASAVLLLGARRSLRPYRGLRTEDGR